MPKLTEPKPVAISFLVAPGKKACYHDFQEDTFTDVMVKRVHSRGRLADVCFVDNPRKVITVESRLLEKPIDADVNERFRYFGELSELVLQKRLKSLFVSGEGGIGKSFTVSQCIQLAGLQEDVDFNLVKGHITPFALYQTLEKNKDIVNIFDDCDGILDDTTCLMMLKAVLDTYDVRKVSWLTSRGGGGSFVFNGSVIFLSNRSKEDVDDAIMSRSVVVDLYMTPAEKIQRMEHILPHLEVGGYISDDDRRAVLEMIDKYKHTISNLNLRTLIKGLTVMQATCKMDLVRYQILNT